MKTTLALLAVASIVEATWRSGAVSTYERFTYGKVVASMKTPNRKGTVASIYSYWDGPDFYPEAWNEIDISVVPSVAKTPLSTNVIYGDGHHAYEDHKYDTGKDTSDSDWHTYSFEWTPKYIAWFKDDRQIRKIDASDNEAVEFMHRE